MKDHLPAAPIPQAISVAEVEKRMISVRGQSVLLDRDVASLYGVETKHVNQAVRNNPGRFPAGYVLELSEMELHGLRSNFLTANVSSKSRVLPKAFTEPSSRRCAHRTYAFATSMKFSIVTPNFNYGRFLKKALESVYSQVSEPSNLQTCEPANRPADAPAERRPDIKIEHIVIDGGSTDDSVAILKNWATFAAAQPAAKNECHTFSHVS